MSVISNGHVWKFTNFLENKNYSFDNNKIFNSLSKKEIDEAYLSISSWEDYSPTPLIELNKLSKELNLNKIFYKDESKRFNLKSFKALGGAYAVEKVSAGNKKIIVATATAGNHGRSVAWGAKRLGLKCKIFISEYVSEARGQAMTDLGAVVILGEIGDNFAAGMTGGMAFIYDKSKEFEKKVNQESVVWQTIETEYWINLLKKLVLEHSKETNSSISKNIILNFDQEIKNFIQVCPKEMIDKLENPITLKSSIKEVS